MSRVLLVEDDLPLARGIIALLKANGYSVDHVARGAAVLPMEGAAASSVIVLDVGLPDRSGFDVLNDLRAAGNQTPVLVLTARDAFEDRIRGLDLGADDYLLKPFDPGEFLARLRALLRRGHGEHSSTISIGTLEYESTTGTASLAGSPLHLRPREAAVLKALVSQAGKVVRRERIISEVFSLGDEVAPNALEIYIARLRRKLQPDGPRIRTVRGIGYAIDP